MIGMEARTRAIFVRNRIVRELIFNVNIYLNGKLAAASFFFAHFSE